MYIIYRTYTHNASNVTDTYTTHTTVYVHTNAHIPSHKNLLSIPKIWHLQGLRFESSLTGHTNWVRSVHICEWIWCVFVHSIFLCLNGVLCVRLTIHSKPTPTQSCVFVLCVKGPLVTTLTIVFGQDCAVFAGPAAGCERER